MKKTLSFIEIIILIISVLCFFGCGSEKVYGTIEPEANKAALESMRGYDGVVAVQNYKTGELVCCVSVKDGIVTSELSDFDNPDNNFLYGLFVPGSIMKIVTTVCAIRNDCEKFDYNCTGESEYLSGSIKCPYPHGNVDFEKAFGYSCNCFYGRLALEIGEDAVFETAGQLGFNRKMNYNGIKTETSIFNPHIDEADFAWSCIGQASSKVNPAHFITMVSTIANGGVCPVPGMDIQTGVKEANALKYMMNWNVSGFYNGRMRFPGINMCGKTGTAETAGEISSSLFVGFSADDDFPYSVFCVIEQGGAGVERAMNSASSVLTYIAEKEGYSYSQS